MTVFFSPHNSLKVELNAIEPVSCQLDHVDEALDARWCLKILAVIVGMMNCLFWFFDSHYIMIV